MKKLYDEKGNEFAELSYCKEYFLNYSKHSHDTFVLTLFTEGEIEVEFHGESKDIVFVNDIITFNPYQVHQTKSKTEKTLDYYSLYLDEEWCKKVQSKLFDQNDYFIEVQNILKDRYLYKELLDMFESILKKDSFEYEKLQRVLVELFREYAICDIKKDKEHFLCKEVEKYISKNLNEQITIEDIAKAVGYNESYITRVFKNYSGLTPHAFLVNKRVQKARNILSKNKRINLAQLSSSVGFYDQSHFSKAFKRTFAISPNKYRDS